jgi:hypothetical protein
LREWPAPDRPATPLPRRRARSHRR